MRTCLLEAPNIHVFVGENPEKYVYHPQGVEKYFNYYKEPQEDIDWSRNIVWFFGPSGTYKTRRAIQKAEHAVKVLNCE